MIHKKKKPEEALKVMAKKKTEERGEKKRMDPLIDP